MNKLRLLFLVFICLTLTDLSVAQSQTFDDFNGSRNARRQSRRCTESFAMRSFNRDFAGLSATHYYHLEKELKDYTRYRCLTAEQTRRLALLFPTDREKYDFLLFSFTYVFDIENYAMTGTVMANRNARDAFHRFLVREGVPAGDYFVDPYYAGAVAYGGVPLPPQYSGNAYYNTPLPNGYNNNGNNYSNNPYDNYRPNNGNNGNNTNTNPNNNGNGLNSGPQGVMNYREFEALKARVRQNTFDRKRVEIAKSATKQNILTANQVVEIVQLITSDNNRLDYAKYAFDYVADRENYPIVVEAMAFESSKKELQRYIDDGRKR